MKKRVLALLLTLVMVTSVLVGCGSTPTPTPTPTPSASTTPTSTEGSTPTLSGKLEVAVFSNGDQMDQFWNTVVKEFNGLYPDVAVTLVANPKIEESMRPRIIAGTPPDIYYMGGSANMDEATLTAEGKFLKLTDFLNTATAIGYDGLLKDNLAAQLYNKVGDDVYGMGFAYGVWGYYYNAAMAEKYGWNPPNNWEEFTALAPKIKAEGIYPIIHQGKYPDYMGYGLMQPGIASSGGKEQLVKMANLDASAYKSDVVLNAYKKYEAIRDNDWAPKSSLSLTHTEAQMQWLQGKSFIIPCGNWLEGEMVADIPDGFKMGFMPSFWFDGDKTPTYVAFSARVSIFANTQNPEAAKAFLQVLYSKNMTKAVVEFGMGIPVVKDTLEGLEMSPSNKAVLAQTSSGEANVINEVGGSGNFEPYGEQRAVTTNNIAAILGGQKSAEQAVEDLAKEIERILNDASITKIPIF